ncbi:polyprenyl synthetase family protein [Kitasatospora purpeofusca]|uniref:Polyprenyl synthetase family protein n=1 Tax=Kitasatospora purpeofusca TaxID=67352 RepID=A0ABZ1TUJ2_9ACTN|nr:polyprenyl synthetase family protein [Kitasatospora purpeofusca]
MDPVVREAVDGLPASMRRIAGYHFGWWDTSGAPIRAELGKSVRPALVLCAARAVGGDASLAVPAAAAVELVHNCSLLHDDVMDGAPTWRHRPTVWTAFGVPEAVLTGDALLASAFRVLAEGPAPFSVTAVVELATACQRLCEGQSEDVSFERQVEVSLDQARRTAVGKTASLIGSACALGGVFAGADHTRVESLRRFGEHIGLAYQLLDDLLGIWGDPEATGKPAGADLTGRKKSLPVVAALCSDTDAGRQLAKLYRHGDPRDAAATARMAGLIEEAGGRAWALGRADAELAAADAWLDELSGDPNGIAELRTLADLITYRDR